MPPHPDYCSFNDASFDAPVETTVGATVAFEALGETDCDTHLWDFGDGTQSDAHSPEHVFTEPGHYLVVHRETPYSGDAASTSSQLVTVYRESIGPTSASSTLIEDGDGWIAVVPEFGVVRVSATGRQVYDGCSSPRTVARGAALIAVACEDDDALVLLDGLGEVRRIDLGRGSRPYGVAHDGEAWWVSLQGTGQMARFDDELTVYAVGPEPRGVAVGPSGRVFATRFRSLDGEGLIYEVDASSIPLAFADVVDSDNTSRGVPNLLSHLVVSPDGQTLYVPGQVSNIARGVYLDGQVLTHETSLRAVLRGVGLGDGQELRALDRQLDNHGRVGAAALSPRGDWLWVAAPDTGTVFQIDAYSGRPESSLHNVGVGLTGLAMSEDGERLAVHAWLDRTVRVYDTESQALLDELPTVDVEPLDADVLVGKRLFHDASDVRMTKDGYVSCAACHPDGRDDGLTWDFTDRGEGMRNTTSLEGRAGTAMGPLHWTANFDEVQDFEHDIRGPFAGHGFLDQADWVLTDDTLGLPKAGRSAELDGLARYLESLDATPTSPFATDAAGEVLFDALCASCHPAPLYTDSSLTAPVRHDVGTLTVASGERLGGVLDGLDTPTLLGVWATDPYLHDGSAETLEEAIAAHVRGVVRTPTSAEMDSLVGFIRSL
ncbi:MAG: PKD domain-containing protein [Proteobacteria bacterium]|nr:PKD domain-containing protein [Pseudomonadota bacterium]